MQALVAVEVGRAPALDREQREQIGCRVFEVIGRSVAALRREYDHDDRR